MSPINKPQGRTSLSHLWCSEYTVKNNHNIFTEKLKSNPFSHKQNSTLHFKAFIAVCAYFLYFVYVCIDFCEIVLLLLK